MHPNETESLLQQLQQKDLQIQRLQLILHRYADLKTNLEEKQSALLSTASWKLTAPLRTVNSLLKSRIGIGKSPGAVSPAGAYNSEFAYCSFISAARINVLCSPAAVPLAGTLSALLRSVGLLSDVLSYDASGAAAALCIAIDPPRTAVLPPVYVLCHASGALDFSLAANAFAILEAEEDSLALYEGDSSLSPKVFYLPCEDALLLQFYFLRFLLAQDMLSFDTFYDRTKSCISLPGDRLCLSLPESVQRRAAFSADNQFGFSFFPGIKHRVGWVGCAMSYKYMAQLALDSGMHSLLICEDDVLFPKDFAARFAAVQSYLSAHPDWDVFSGIMADVSDSVSVLRSEEYSSQHFLWLEELVSTVFNLYGEKALQLLAAWDESDPSSNRNTIDRSLQFKSLQVVTTAPFLVGHKEDLHSTIWNVKNTDYSGLIFSSSKKLKAAWRSSAR